MEIKEWVRPFIKEQLKDSFTSEYPPAIIDGLDASSICVAMVRFFKVFDMTGGLKNEYLIPIGEVFCRLPKQVFLEFYEDNLLFLVPSFAGASTLRMDESLIVIVIPLMSLGRSKSVVIGEIVHELAHIYAGHIHLDQDELTNQHEKEADKIATAWGFKNEIRAMNKEIQSIKQTIKTVRKRNDYDLEVKAAN
ncbi:MAG: hypothetical protein ACFFCW_23835 [Candidatus Hodarchaeota archaeon]